MPLILHSRYFGLVRPMTIKAVGFSNRQQSEPNNYELLYDINEGISHLLL